MRRRLTASITALALALTVFAVPAFAAGSDNLIYRVGAKERSVKAGQEFELKVTHGKGLDDDQIKWTIGNTKIVKLDDDDRYDDEVEFKALKKGTVKIAANNQVTGGKIVYTINVKPALGKYNMAYVGKAKKYRGTNDDFELEVRKGSSLKENQIKWTIGNSNLLKFEDGDKYGKEVELEPKGKAGTVKVTAHNLKTGGKLVYTIILNAKYND